MNLSEKTAVGKNKLGLSLSNFVKQLGDPYACIPEENYRMLTEVIRNQHMIQQVVGMLETQELHKLFEKKLENMRIADDLLSPDRLEAMEDKDLVAYAKHQSDTLTKLYSLLRSPQYNSITQNLFVVDSTKDPLKNGMTADERTAVRAALEKIVGKTIVTEGEVVDE